MARLRGKVALISGGACGLGAAHARRFVDEGARVVVADLLDGEGAAVCRELGLAARYQHLDVTHPEEWETAVAGGGIVRPARRARRQCRYRDVGRVRRSHGGDMGACDRSQSDRGLHGTRAALAELKRSGAASVINVSSAAGIVGVPGLASYTASKFGLRGLTKSAAAQLGRYGIRVNSVHPGRIQTPLSTGNGIEALKTLALPRRGEASEVAELVVFLASDESSYSTGSEFVVDGGMTAGTVAD